MKFKRVLSILIIIIFIMHLNIKFVLAINSNNNSIQFPNEKPVNSNQERKITPNRISIDELEKNKRTETLTNSSLSKTEKNKKILKTLSKSVDEYQGQLEENKNDISRTFIFRDNKHYTYTINQDILPNVSINRYCFETNESIEIYKNEELYLNNYYSIIHNMVYIKNTIIYFAAFSKTDNTQLRIFGYNTENESISYSKSFQISEDNYAKSFCIDNNENVYIVIKGQTDNSFRINTYNKDGNLISSVNQDLFSSYYAIKITNSTEKMIWIQGFVLENNYLYPVDIAMRTNNGIFVNNTPTTLNNIGMHIVFLNEEQTIAHDQYGQFLEISYTDDSVKMSILNHISIKSNEYFFIPYENTVEEQYIYAGGENGIILKYNWNTFKIEKAISIGDDKTVIGVFKDNNQLYVEYMDDNYNVFALILDCEEFFTTKKTIEITEHSNLNRTKNDIITKYTATNIVNKMNYYNVYNEEPSITAPYTAGSINEQTRIDTLNQINYFRWLAGVNEVTINEDYMEYAQCGAVLLTTSSELMHNPSQPNDMPDEFYEKGLGATNAEIGVPMSANISVYAPLAESIKGYVDDVANIEPDIGHRLSILDDKATTTSFGFAGYNGTVDMFIQLDAIPENDFYSWPSPGFFPVESIDKDAMWSISFNGENMYPTGKTNIIIKTDENEYSLDNNNFEAYYEDYYNTYYYSIPNELKTYLTNGKNIIQKNKKVEIQITGLSDLQGNEYTIKSPVEFMSIEENVSLYKKGDVNGNGTVDMTDYSMILKHVKGIKTLTGEQLERADVNQNSSIDMTDYSMVLKHVKGIKLLD